MSFRKDYVAWFIITIKIGFNKSPQCLDQSYINSLIFLILKKFAVVNKMYKFLTENKMAFSIIFFGVICRITQFLSNRSFAFDEVLRVLELKKYSFIELLQVKGFVATKINPAPYGFLLIQKLGFIFMGDSEYALRLFPFICGLLSLFLYKKIINWFVSTKASLIALSFFAISHHLIFYASEVKPYSSDLLVTLLIFILLKHIYLKELNFSKIIVFGFLGGVSIWFSFPAVFILAGGGFSLMMEKIWNRDLKKFVYISGICTIWLISFLAYYFLSLRYFTADLSLSNYWEKDFFALSWQGIALFYKSFENPSGLYIPQLGLVLFLVGCWAIFQKEKIKAAIITLPIVFTLIASALMKYPFSDRLLLFLMPSYYILIAKGFEVFVGVFNKRRLIIFVCLFLVFVHPFSTAMYHLFQPFKNEEIRPVIRYLKEGYKQGDLLYVYSAAAPGFEYYSERLNFNPKSEYLSTFLKESDIDQFNGEQRVWFLFSHNDNNDEQFFLHHFNQVGEKKDSYKEVGSAVYLYKLGLNQIQQ